MPGTQRRAAGGTDDGVPLGLLLRVLGPGARVVRPGAGPDAAALDVVLLDAGAVAGTRGCVVVANGADPSAPGWEPLLRQLGEAGAVAVLVRPAGPAGPAGPAVAAWTADDTGPAGPAGPAVVMVDPTLAWEDVHLLLRSALASAGGTLGPAGSLAAVPLGDLFALANTVAAACRGAVSVEDPQRRVLAYSSLPGHEVDETRRLGILGRQVPSEAVDEELYRRLVRQGEVLAEHAEAELPRLAVPVTAGGENLGSLWLIATPGVVSPDAREVLAEAAPVAAVHLLRARAAADLERSVRTALVVRLLEGTLAGDHVARRLGWPPTGCVVVGLDLGPDLGPYLGSGGAPGGAAGTGGGGDGGLDRLADMVSLRLQGTVRGAVAVTDGDTVYALVPAQERSVPALHALVGRVVQDARQALRAPVRAAVGDLVGTLAEAAGSRQQVDHLLQIMTDGAGGPLAAVPCVATVASRRPQVVLRELAVAAREHPWLLGGSPVAAMTATDAARGTRYAATVAAYLQSPGDSGETARRLHVHPNTLRYRLRRASELFGIDLADPDTRLVLALELRALAGGDPTGPPG